MRKKKSLNEMLSDAVKIGSYFVTISYKDKKNKLQHYYNLKDYYRDDIIPSLRKLEEMVKENEADL